MGHFLSNLLESSLSFFLLTDLRFGCGLSKMISKCPSQVVTWSISCLPSFIDNNTNVLVYDNGVLHRNFSYIDCCKKLEKIITGSNQLKGRGQGKFCRKWEEH